MLNFFSFWNLFWFEIVIKFEREKMAKEENLSATKPESFTPNGS